MRIGLIAVVSSLALAGLARAEHTQETADPPVPRPPLAYVAAAEPTERPSPRRREVRFSLPPALRVDVQAALARLDLRGMAFRSPGGLQLRGDAMRLEAGVAFGAGFSIGAAGRNGGVSFGFLYVAPDDSGAVALGGPLRGLHVARWTLEAGFMRRVGDVVPFVLVEGGVLRATADLQEPFVSVHAHRFTVGPRIGLRAYLHKALYAQIAFFVDLLTLPDHILSVGIGLARR
ncbi:MAG: hypothetical protein KF901_21615 [Myxococcales bacterium]|nr:hypothetical protein [Myxococcales bacterium]